MQPCYRAGSAMGYGQGGPAVLRLPGPASSPDIAVAGACLMFCGCRHHRQEGCSRQELSPQMPLGGNESLPRDFFFFFKNISLYCIDFQGMK